MVQIALFLVGFSLLLEGLGAQSSHEVSFVIVILTGPVLFVDLLFRSKKVLLPKKITALFFMLVVSSFISSIIGIDLGKSMGYTLFLSSTFLIFLYAYNFQNDLSKMVINVIFGLASIFSLYSLLLNSHLLYLFEPINGYQFVFPRFGLHNHLGDFLTIPFVICIYNLYKKRGLKIAMLGASVLGVFMLFSLSRSAYLSTIATCLTMYLFSIKKDTGIKFKLNQRILFSCLIILTFLLFIAVTNQPINQPFMSLMNNIMVHKNLEVSPRDFTGERLEYMYQSIQSISTHPFLGVGPNNFSAVSKMYSSNNLFVQTDSAHNIFLEIFVGQGILGLLPFIGIITLILLKSQKNALYFAMLAMLINFQTDYTYLIYSFLALFFFIAGVIYRKEK